MLHARPSSSSGVVEITHLSDGVIVGPLLLPGDLPLNQCARHEGQATQATWFHVRMPHLHQRVDAKEQKEEQ